MDATSRRRGRCRCLRGALVALAALGILAWLAPSGAQETSAQETTGAESLISLKKETVGPWNNFQATIDERGQRIYFVQSRNQNPDLYARSLAEDTLEPILTGGHDIKDPTLRPGGGTLAITYFSRDAQGDVCLLELDTRTLDCLTDATSAEQEPFWVDRSTLGFVRRNSFELERQLVLLDLDSRRETIAYQGLVSTPSASPDGRYIVFNDLDESDIGYQLLVLDRRDGTLTEVPPFDLPGISGLGHFSPDGTDYFFTHYLNDTSLDEAIDGEDHSVIFRIPFANMLATDREKLFPEQQTSVANNCSFPFVGEERLYLTCAFEGSLDIYSLPTTGMVPAAWGRETLQGAHRIARSHEERLLLLNALRYRHGLGGTSVLERLLSHHLEINEFSAVTYYVGQLEALYAEAGDAQLEFFYATLGKLLQVLAARQREPEGVVTARFRNLVEQVRGELPRNPRYARFTQLGLAYFDFELENFSEALARLERVDFNSPLLPMERYLTFKLYRLLLERDRPVQLLGLYPQMYSEARFSSEAQLHYAYQFLRLSARVFGTDLAARLSALNRALEADPPGPVAELFRMERLSLELANSADKSEQRATFNALTGLLKRNQADVITRKVLHTRAIQVLGEAESFQYMELLSRHWLLTTEPSEMEFVNVATQYSLITMDKAYGFMDQGELGSAYNVFYSAIRQTNDLEAHYQFITLGLNPQTERRDNMDQAYAALAREGLLADKRAYVEALTLLLDPTEGSDERTRLDRAQALIADMDRVTPLSPGVLDLMIGYIHHRYLRVDRDGFDYDVARFQKANHAYLLALDRGFDNPRLSAAAWRNLGILHFDVGNYGLARDFFSNRVSLPFEDAASELSTRWLYARALFYNQAFAAASAEAEHALTLARGLNMELTPFLERSAFYAMYAEDYTSAAQRYETLLQTSSESLEEANRVKAQLALGYSLLRLDDLPGARAALDQVLAGSQRLEPIPAGGDRRLPFYPERLRLLAHGFLAQAAPSAEEAMRHRQARLELLGRIGGRPEDFAYDEAGRLAFLVKELNHLAATYEVADLHGEMAGAVAEAIAAALRWRSESGSRTGPVLYHTFVNAMTLRLSHPQAFDADLVARLADPVADVLDALERQIGLAPAVSAIEDYATLAMLRAALPAMTEAPVSPLEALNATPGIDRVRAGQRAVYQRLEAMAQQLSAGRAGAPSGAMTLGATTLGATPPAN